MNKAKTLLLTVFVLLLASCKQQSPYFVNDVDISIKEVMVSRTFAKIEFETDRPAFYYVGIIPLDSTTEIPSDSDYHFMYMKLDEAYMYYVDWRHDLLEQKVPYIASFTDHVLEYGKIETYFTGLWVGWDYIVYAFAVDPQLQIPVGKLFKKKITTSTEDATKHMHFDFTVDGYWDFVYPVDSSRNVISDIPYIAQIVSRDTILNFFEGDTTHFINKPIYYFAYNALPKKEINYIDGVSGREHRNSNVPSVINFEKGETYYVGICSLDGAASDNWTVYKFTWQGDTTHIEYHFEYDDIGSYW